MISRMGFNSVRLPINHVLLENQENWKYIDEALKWAELEKDNLRATLQYKTRDSNDVFGVAGFYSMGANTFAAAWERVTPDQGEDLDLISLQALHNLSDHMYVYVEGYLGTQDDQFGSGNDTQTDVAVGGTYYF